MHVGKISIIISNINIKFKFKSAGRKVLEWVGEGSESTDYTNLINNLRKIHRIWNGVKRTPKQIRRIINY